LRATTNSGFGSHGGHPPACAADPPVAVALALAIALGVPAAGGTATLAFALATGSGVSPGDFVGAVGG
jgi:hypothetical protein